MQDSRSLMARTGNAFALVAIALLAAALGHVAIDALGDVVLAHDTYDDVAHDSRTVAAAAAGAAMLAAAARWLYDTLGAALGRRAARRAFQVVSPLRYCAAVIALSIPFVLAMETVDAAVAHHPVDDFGDLCGGSIMLGLGTTIAVAFGVALAAVAVLRFFCTTRTLLMRAVSGLFQARKRVAIHAFNSIARRPACLFAHLVERRHAAKRGPPLFVIANRRLNHSRHDTRSFLWLCSDCARAARRLSSSRPPSLLRPRPHRS